MAPSHYVQHSNYLGIWEGRQTAKEYWKSVIKTVSMAAAIKLNDDSVLEELSRYSKRPYPSHHGRLMEFGIGRRAEDGATSVR